MTPQSIYLTSRRSFNLALLIYGISFSVVAENQIERIEVRGQQIMDQVAGDSLNYSPQPDVAGWLRDLPGADVNRNGPVSGIAQYRGLYGDRVNVSVGGRPAIGAGPNAMDAPLSYAPEILTQDLVLYRGITPVSAGIDTLGGGVEVVLFEPEFGSTSNLSLGGATRAGYRDNGSASQFAGRVNLAQREHALLLFGEDLYGRDDIEDGHGREITPSEYHKRLAGAGYRYRLDSGYLGLDYQYLDTKDAGTPALPMDIDYIRTHRGGISANWLKGDWDLQASLGLIDADHVMDNYRLRSNSNPMAYRKNTTTNDSYDWKLTATTEIATGDLTLGLDGYMAEHDAVITNPNNAMFQVVNFNGVEDNRYGLFAEWQGFWKDWSILGGARVKYIQADANEVAHSMAMMNPNIGELVQRFNNADRSQNDTNLDLALSADYPLNDELQAVVSVAFKQRSPSYQERYLWVPMQATGGLADGKTYIGDIELDPEKAWQLDLGVDWQRNNWRVSPRLFYQRIDDYIQGAPVDDPVVKMAAAMMGDDNPLQFSNLDAEIYGADVLWRGQLNEMWEIGGQASYIRGKRRDISDDLYRIAPPNTSLYLQYQIKTWRFKANWRIYAEQDKVASTNDEQPTPGYGVVDVNADYQVNADWLIRLGADNLLDKAYQDHLAGYNRVMDSEFVVGERLTGPGRSIWLNTEYQF